MDTENCTGFFASESRRVSGAEEHAALDLLLHPLKSLEMSA
jgi:hypothetical protein